MLSKSDFTATRLHSYDQEVLPYGWIHTQGLSRQSFRADGHVRPGTGGVGDASLGTTSPVGSQEGGEAQVFSVQVQVVIV